MVVLNGKLKKNSIKFVIKLKFPHHNKCKK